MAEEATKKLAERNKRAEEQLKLERKLATLRAERVQLSREPLVANDSLAAAAAGAKAKPVRALVAQQAPVAQPQEVAQPQHVAQQAAAPAKATQPALDPAEAAPLLGRTDPAPAQAPPGDRGTNPAPAKEQPHLASQPMLQNVKIDKLTEMFGFSKAAEEVAPDASARKPAPKDTEAAAEPNGMQASEKPAGDMKKTPIVPADAPNFGRAPISVQ